MVGAGAEGLNPTLTSPRDAVWPARERQHVLILYIRQITLAAWTLSMPARAFCSNGTVTRRRRIISAREATPAERQEYEGQ